MVGACNPLTHLLSLRVRALVFLRSVTGPNGCSEDVAVAKKLSAQRVARVTHRSITQRVVSYNRLLQQRSVVRQTGEFRGAVNSHLVDVVQSITNGQCIRM